MSESYGILGSATFVNATTEQRGALGAGVFTDFGGGGGGGPTPGASLYRMFPVEDTARLFPRKNLNRLFPVT